MSKRILSVAFFLLLAAIPSSAGPLGSIGHKIKEQVSELAHNPQEMLQDAAVTGIYLAAARTDPCIRPAPCEDHSQFFPLHPTSWQVTRPALLISGILAGVNRSTWALDPEPDKATAKWLGWMRTTALDVNEGFDIRSNLKWRQ